MQTCESFGTAFGGHGRGMCRIANFPAVLTAPGEISVMVARHENERDSFLLIRGCGFSSNDFCTSRQEHKGTCTFHILPQIVLR
jgi:hypothetical protein